MTNLHFFIPGICKPGGSKKSFRHKYTQKIVTIDDCDGNAAWRDRVAYYVRKEYRGEPLDCPLYVDFEFRIQRPGRHFGTGRNAGVIKSSAPTHPTVKPDCTKLIRAAEDALTGILWRDDALIVRQTASKGYGAEPGLKLSVYPLQTPAPSRPIFDPTANRDKFIDAPEEMRRMG